MDELNFFVNDGVLLATDLQSLTYNGLATSMALKPTRLEEHTLPHWLCSLELHQILCRREETRQIDSKLKGMKGGN